MFVYEKELLALVIVLEKWRPYLLGSHFTITTDHHNLKFLLEQRITNSSQPKWSVELMGYDYDINYKKGKENILADELSRWDNLVELCNIFGVHVPQHTQ